MNMKRAARYAIAALAVSAVPAFSSSLQTFNNQALFNAQLSSYYTVGFDNLVTTPGMAVTFNDLNGYLDSFGDRFVGINSTDSPYLTVYLPYATQTSYMLGSGPILIGPYWQNEPSRYTQITLAAPVYALGMSLATAYPTAGSLTVTLSTGDVITPIPTLATPASQWFGVISSTPITWLDVQAISGQPLMDNFEFGAPLAAQQDTPEAATLLMIGTGLLALRFLKRSRGRRPAMA